MSDEDEALRSFTSWKLDILNCMVSDPRISDGHLRMAIRILQAVNEQSREAVVGDDLLADEVPRCDRFKAHDCRRSLTDLKWWTVEPGSGSRASVYRFRTDNLNAIFDKLDVDREARREVRRKRRTASRTKRVVVKSPRPDRVDVVELPRPKDAVVVVKSPRCSEGDVVELPRGDVVKSPPVHLQGTPSPISLPVEDVALAHVCAREAQPLAMPPKGNDARLELLTLVGRGSFAKGLDLVSRLTEFDRWTRMLRDVGLTRHQVTYIQQAADKARKLSEAA